MYRVPTQIERALILRAVRESFKGRLSRRMSPFHAQEIGLCAWFKYVYLKLSLLQCDVLATALAPVSRSGRPPAPSASARLICDAPPSPPPPLYFIILPSSCTTATCLSADRKARGGRPTWTSRQHRWRQLARLARCS